MPMHPTFKFNLIGSLSLVVDGLFCLSCLISIEVIDGINGSL